MEGVEDVPVHTCCVAGLEAQLVLVDQELKCGPKAFVVVLWHGAVDMKQWLVILVQYEQL